MFLKLTTLHGSDPIWLNSERVVSISPIERDADHYTQVSLGMGQTYNVRETPDEILGQVAYYERDTGRS